MDFVLVEDQFSQLQKKLGNVPWTVLEEFILTNSHIWRTIRGHAFETYFDKVIHDAGYEIKPGKGDDIVDRVLLNKTLQLKTPYTNGTKSGVKIAYMLHKTHGLEKRPFNLYKSKDFADFLLGYHPNGIIICPKDEIPLQKDYPSRKWGEYIADPAIFAWDCEWLNNYNLLGLDSRKIQNLSFNKDNKKFPEIGKLTKLSDKDIVGMILKPENFRVLEMNLLGSIREWHFEQIAKKNNIVLDPPSGSDEIKIDFWSNGKRIQVKGRTKSICSEDKIGVEVKGSHGRIPQRLYKKNSFDYLVVVLDPNVIPEKYYPKGIDPSKFNCVVIPTKDLPIHPRSSEWGDDYLKDIYKFKMTAYPINDLSLLK